MAEQTEQYGYLFRFDKVIATALHMLLQLHLGMKSIRSMFLCSDYRESRVFREYAVCIFPRIPRDVRVSLANSEGFQENHRRAVRLKDLPWIGFNIVAMLYPEVQVFPF